MLSYGIGYQMENSQDNSKTIGKNIGKTHENGGLPSGYVKIGHRNTVVSFLIKDGP